MNVAIGVIPILVGAIAGAAQALHVDVPGESGAFPVGLGGGANGVVPKLALVNLRVPGGWELANLQPFGNLQDRRTTLTDPGRF